MSTPEVDVCFFPDRRQLDRLFASLYGLVSCEQASECETLSHN